MSSLLRRPGRSTPADRAYIRHRIFGPENVSSVTDADTFLAFDRPGFAKATFSFFLDDDAGDGRVRLVTETRIQATSPEARQAFLRYWLLIRLGSGFVRRVMLSAIRARALKTPLPVPETGTGTETETGQARD